MLNPSRIDGFTITGADSGGGIFVNGYAHQLEIANNPSPATSGFRHGGIRIGQPFLPGLAPNANGIIAFNTSVNIHHNAITLNGALGEQAPAAVWRWPPAPNNYRISRNFVCGNFTSGDGGGIGHLGLSNNGVIAAIRSCSTRPSTRRLTVPVAGIFIAGEPAATGLTLGAGSVTVDANLIQGNHAGAGTAAASARSLSTAYDRATQPSTRGDMSSPIT